MLQRLVAPASAQFQRPPAPAGRQRRSGATCSCTCSLGLPPAPLSAAALTTARPSPASTNVHCPQLRQPYKPPSAASGPAPTHDLQPPPSSIQHPGLLFLIPVRLHSRLPVCLRLCSVLLLRLSRASSSSSFGLCLCLCLPPTPALCILTPYIPAAAVRRLSVRTSTSPHRHRDTGTDRPDGLRVLTATETRPSSGNHRPTSSSLFPRSDHKPARWPRPADFRPLRHPDARLPVGVPCRPSLVPKESLQPAWERPLTNGTGQDSQSFLPFASPPFEGFPHFHRLLAPSPQTHS
ncbi:hypothetical protein TgHK011_000095 [Trichoderma gracile]|nr:hypothetical protein TgHK011_000095 [Trichoderma gracile]